MFTLSDYGGAGNVSYIRFAKGVITKNSQMKSAPDMKAYGAKYFRSSDTSAFAALSAVNGQTTTYTVQVMYASGYYEFIHFDITPTLPVIAAGSGSITVYNVRTADYYMDWIRCAPGDHNTLSAIRHARKSRVRFSNEMTAEGMITFTGLSAGTYSLYYLYDGWNLSEGLVKVTVS